MDPVLSPSKFVLFVAAQPLLKAYQVENPHTTTTHTKTKKPWHPDQLRSESETSESENEVIPIKKPRLETTNNDDIHLTTIKRVLASHIENLELKNKDKTAECEFYRLQTVQLQQQLKDLKDKAVTKHSKSLLYKASLDQQVQPLTSKTGKKKLEI